MLKKRLDIRLLKRVILAVIVVVAAVASPANADDAAPTAKKRFSWFRSEAPAAVQPEAEPVEPQLAALAVYRQQIALRADRRVALAVGSELGYVVGDRLKIYEKVVHISQGGERRLCNKFLGEVTLVKVHKDQSEGVISRDASFSDLLTSPRPLAAR